MAEKDKLIVEELTLRPTGGFEELEQLPSLYINNVEMSFTPFDVRFVLGENLGPHENELHVKRRVKVFMSLEHAKAFARLLVGGLNQFEQASGQQIPVFDLTTVAQEDAE